MKLFFRCTLITFFYLVSFSAFAEEFESNQDQQQTNANTKNLVKYLLNLGGFLGYDLSKSPTENNATISQTLFDMPAMQVTQNYLFNTFLGAIPVNAFSQALSQFLPPNFPKYTTINAFANYTFSLQTYSTPSSQEQGTVSVSTLIDQKTFQPDPVSQAVLNILGTPDYSYCMSYDSSSWDPDCSLLVQTKVMSNVIGTIPNTRKFFAYDYNQEFMSQLNSNSLMAPLLYSTENKSSNSTSSGNPRPQNQGLTAQSQAQQAANFIRYVSGATSPIDLPKFKEYDILYTQALNSDGRVPKIQQMQAQATLARYLTGIRTYVAQSSVGLSNLYYILSKRMPQNQSADGSKPTSQAMSEFTSATWRLFTPDLQPNKQWINQINSASPATVQKEIATLLAEINYQLYLNRQQEERMLLTNTMILIQNTKANQPSPDLTTQTAIDAPK